MSISKELQEKINMMFPDEEEIREKLLALDAGTIRNVGAASRKPMDPKDVVKAYESNDSKKMENLYKKAKELVELQKLYKDLCLEYYNKSNRSGNEER